MRKTQLLFLLCVFIYSASAQNKYIYTGFLAKGLLVENGDYGKFVIEREADHFKLSAFYKSMFTFSVNVKYKGYDEIYEDYVYIGTSELEDQAAFLVPPMKGKCIIKTKIKLGDYVKGHKTSKDTVMAAIARFLPLKAGIHFFFVNMETIDHRVHEDFLTDLWVYPFYGLTDKEMALQEQENLKRKQEAEKRAVELKLEEEKRDTVDKEYFFGVEDMPLFPGGNVLKWIAENVKYPALAMENGIQGKVYVKFYIETDGSITDVKVVRGVDASLDKEAVRVLQTMPKWKPGKRRGVPIRTEYTLPINFQITNK